MFHNTVDFLPFSSWYFCFNMKRIEQYIIIYISNNDKIIQAPNIQTV